MSDVDWAEFFESVSLVDEVLRARQRLRGHGLRDAQPLPQRHRRAGARLRLSELEIAQARCSQRGGATARRRARARSRLLSDRRRAGATFERESAFAPPLRDWPRRIAFTVGAADYVGGDRLLAALCSAVPLGAHAAFGIDGPMLWLLGAARRVPAIGDRDRAREPRRHARRRREPPAAAWSCATACRRTAHAGRRADAADSTRRRSRSSSTGSRSTTSHRPTSDLHFALLSDWTDAATEHVAGRRRAARRRRASASRG